MTAPASNRALGGAEATLAVARVTMLRLRRGRALRAMAALALLPLLAAVALGDHAIHGWPRTAAVWSLVAAILPPVLLASAIGEEFEERTASYLWSRPLPRWSIVVGKLCGLVPALWAALALAMLLPLLGWFDGAAHPGVLGRALAAAIVGGLALSAAVAGLATLAPRWATVLGVGYLLFVEQVVASLDLSVSKLAVAFHARQLLRIGTVVEGPGTAVGWMLALTAVWLGVAVWRVRRLE